MSMSKSLSKGCTTSHTLVMELDVSTKIWVQSVDLAEDLGTVESTPTSLLEATVNKCKSATVLGLVHRNEQNVQ